MSVFDLACAGGHVFEGWFGSTADYDEQRRRGLVSCPLCGDSAVDKAVMAPRVAAKGNRSSAPMPCAPPPEAVKALLGKLAEAQHKALEGSDYVGKRFSEEARAIHFGETPHRIIHGQATPAQAEALREDGVEVAPLPFPLRTPGTDN